MPFRQLGGDAGVYALLAFDGSGAERGDDADGANGKLSVRILDQLSADPAITDVFPMAHGWNGDVADAIDQYDRWFGAMAARAADRDAMARRWPRFAPYRIGLHWPSKAWGDEELGGAAAFASLADPVAAYTERLGGRLGLREEIAVVFQQAAQNPEAAQLPAEAARAYRSIGCSSNSAPKEKARLRVAIANRSIPKPVSRRRAARRISGSAATCKVCWRRSGRSRFGR